MSAFDNNRTTLFGAIFPRTLAGVAMWILLIASGMAASGVAFFAFYQYKLAALEQRIDRFAVEFDKEAATRTREFKALVKDSKAEIEAASKGISRQTNQVSSLLKTAAPSIAYILGQDPAGVPITGSGFLTSSEANQSWVLTNYHLVAGAAGKKAPVRVRIGDVERDGQVWTWDESKDLALVVLKTGNLPVLSWADGEPEMGSRVWAVGSSPGKFKAAASEGFLTDSSADGLMTDAGVPASAGGGPLLNVDGKVLGVLSFNYAPSGYPASAGWVVPIRLSCQKVIRCP